eukprot:CAMPEP_0194030466 /NCGR_PEP_ID=MMETSP0009_2-20130614/3936_1 /TAXON_ID=210454 /ORGANISM="Grammatophora oceanica, Strain CCMP 410" /LENGTH=737 /DNA_ID=CAMNT_0038670413 /DNA_START=215 /DNA_END=2429 /DNA_ORIENTATION=-
MVGYANSSDHSQLRPLTPLQTLSGVERALQDVEQCDVDFCIESYPDTCVEAGSGWVSALPLAVQYILIGLLLGFSALFSGLTLGLMGLDKTGLEIVMEGDDEVNAAAAKIIYPIRSNGNLLLCTLLLGNVAVNALLSILLADISGGTAGFLISTFLIVIFGEILPQALCARYALQIGSKAVPLVRIIMVLLYPLAFPLAWVLNKILGNELATTYSSAEMRKLLEIHVKEGRFDHETAGAMAGALKFKEIAVKQVMTPITNTFMLNVDERLSFETIAVIFKSGYSRIPVYEVSFNNVIGLLFVKDLIFIDPEDETPVRSFVQIFGRGVHVVWPDDTLGDVLRELKQGRSHMALVRDVNNVDETQDPFYEIKGIVTLEDVIEEIIGDEIVDETDAFVDGTHSVKVNRMENFDWGRLRLLDSKIVDATLSFEEARAVTAHFRTNYADAIDLLSEKQLNAIISKTSVIELPTAERDVGVEVPEDLMYEQDVETDHCTLILNGKVTVLAGVDKFRSDVSSWAVLGISALTDSSYKPDFTAFVSSGPCRCIQISRERFQAAVDASVIERRMNPFPPGTMRSPSDDPLTTSERTGSERGSVEIETSLATSQRDLTKNTTSSNPTKTQSRRNRLIAAFQKTSNKKLKMPAAVSAINEESEEHESQRKSGVEFGGVADAQGLNAILSGRGSYAIKPNKTHEEEGMTTGLSPSKTTQSVAYLEPGLDDSKNGDDKEEKKEEETAEDP